MRFFVIFLLLLILFISTDAQIIRKFDPAVKAGINIASQRTTGEGENVNVNNLFAYHAGAQFAMFFTNSIAFQPEIMFSVKGSTWDDPYFSGKEKLNYLEIPVLIRFQPVKQLGVYAGPQFGFLLKASQKPDGADAVDADSYYKTTDTGITFGMEGYLPYNLILGVRYEYGLSVVTEPEVYYLEDWKNTVFQVYVGYRFLQQTL